MSLSRLAVPFVVLFALAVPGKAARADFFVTGVFNNAVLEYNGTTGAFVKTFASGGGLSGPVGLVFGPNGDLFVSGGNNNAVLEYDGTTGGFVKTFASGGGLNAPVGLVFGPNGDLSSAVSVTTLFWSITARLAPSSRPSPAAEA